MGLEPLIVLKRRNSNLFENQGTVRGHIKKGQKKGQLRA